MDIVTGKGIDLNDILEDVKAQNASPNWVLSTERDGVKIYTQPSTHSNNPMPMTKGQSVFSGYDILEVFGTIASMSARAIWDERFDSADLLEWYDNKTYKVYTVQKGTWPVAPREIVARQQLIVEEDGTINLIIASVDAPEIPLGKGRVRANIYGSGWILKPLGGGDLEVTYITHLTVNGTVPSSLLKLVSTNTPAQVGTVKKFIDTHGAPLNPMVQHGVGAATGYKLVYKSDKANISTGDHEINFEAIKDDGYSDALNIVVSKKAYPGGVMFTVNGGANVEVKEGGRIIQFVPTKAGELSLQFSKRDGSSFDHEQI